MKKNTNNNIKKITDPIIKAIEDSKTLPWVKPWVATFTEEDGLMLGNQRSASKKLYHGFNQMSLQFLADSHGYSSPYWMTFNQISQLGGKIKGSGTGTPIAFFKTTTVHYGSKDCKKCKGAVVYINKKTDRPCSHCESRTRKTWVIKPYYVWNISSPAVSFPDGIPKKYQSEPVKTKVVKDAPKNKTIEEPQKLLDKYIKNLKGGYNHGGDRAYYTPTWDKIQMPKFEDFRTPEGYYRTAFHECIHSTGHKSRLDRFSEWKTHRFGSSDYGQEELCAEFGATILCGLLNINPKSEVENSTAYLKGWLKAIKKNPEALVYGISQAKNGVNELLRLAK